MKSSGWRAAVAATIAAAALVAVAAAAAALSPFNASATGANGSGRVDAGVPCADGASGSTWRYAYGAALPAGAFSSLASTAELALTLHSRAPGGAWIGAGATEVVVANERGTAGLALVSGDCDASTLGFDGVHAAGSGTWEVATGTGAYRSATGTGSFSLLASVGPGNSNVFDLDLSGILAVPDAALALDVVRASWAPGERGSRLAVVTYRVTNAGPGDSFGGRVVETTTSTAGVAPLEAPPPAVGDLASGEAALVELTYSVERGRCAIVDHGCAFDATVSVELPDALDVPATYAQTVRVRVPTR